MTFLNLAAAASEEGYSGRVSMDARSVVKDGAAGLYAARKKNNAREFGVRWVLTDGEYQYLRAFYRTETVFGSLSFTAKIIFNDDVAQTLTCRFIPGTLKLSSVSGPTMVVTARLEAEMPVPDPTSDDAIIAAYEAAL